ncbi:MAG TPA: AI-2E family transporter, partial [Beutenbergiaceae bacterium]|nr:AI-2E family transporter [Beutenbergiaceae bacterium]
MRIFGTSRRPPNRAQTPRSHQPMQSTSVWSDKFGRVATRCIQILAMLALAAVGIFLIVQLRLILVPVIIALILASALNPIMEHLRRWKIPGALAALAMMVSILGMFGLIGWLVSWAVINQWDDLVDSAEAG